jgi:hypothetical protein
MKIPPAPESTRDSVLIGSFPGVVIIALVQKELLLSDSFAKKIYIGGIDVETILCFKNPDHSSLLLLLRLSSPLHSWRQ